MVNFYKKKIHLYLILLPLRKKQKKMNFVKVGFGIPKMEKENNYRGFSIFNKNE